MWGISTPAEAKAIIEEQRGTITHEPRNLEEQAISLVGKDIYEKLIRGYTQKQWGRSCKELPPLLSNVSRCAILMITTILMTVTRAFPWAATM